MKFCIHLLLLVTLFPRAATLDAAEPAKRGVSPASAAKLHQIAKANAAKRHTERAKQLQQAAQATVNQLKSERAAFDAALVKQPEFAQLKRDHDALLAAAKDPNLAKSEQQKKAFFDRARAFSKQFDAVQLRAYQQAKVDDNRVRAAIAGNFGRLVPALRIEKRGLSWLVSSREAEVSQPAPTGPACFQPPYDSEYEDMDSALIGIARASADKANGEFSADVVGVIAAGASVNAGIGDHFTVPAGSHQVRVTATMPAEYYIFADAVQVDRGREQIWKSL
jgi:hypothetical protein